MNNVLVLKLGLAQSPFFFPQVLTSHSCSEEGLEDAANVLLQLSRGDPGTRDTGPSMRPSELGPWASSQGRPVGEDRPEIVCLSPSLSLSASHFLSSPAVFSALKFAPTIHPSIWLPVSPQLLPHPEVPTWPTGEPRMALSGHQHTWLLWRLRW